MRIWNEGGYLDSFLGHFSSAIEKALSIGFFGVIGILLLGILLMLGIRLYRANPKEKPECLIGQFVPIAIGIGTWNLNRVFLGPVFVDMVLAFIVIFTYKFPSTCSKSCPFVPEFSRP